MLPDILDTMHTLGTQTVAHSRQQINLIKNMHAHQKEQSKKEVEDLV